MSNHPPANVYDAKLLKPGELLVMIQVQILQPEKLQAYIDGHAPTLAKYGGRLVYVGGEQETVEGDLPVGDIVAVHAWPSREKFMKWYESDEYRPWKTYRQGGVTKATITLSTGFPLD